MQIEILRAANSVLYLPIWIAQQGEMFERLLEDHGFSQYNLTMSQSPTGGDQSCVEALNRHAEPAIGICDPVPLFDTHCKHDQVKLVATLIGRPPFFLAGFNLPAIRQPAGSLELLPTPYDDLKQIDKFIYYGPGFWTGHSIGKALVDELKLSHDKVLEVTYGSEFRALAEELRDPKDLNKKVALITADLINLARFATSVNLNSQIPFSVAWCFARDVNYERFVTTGIVSNLKLAEQSEGKALTAMLSAIQHACILLKSSARFATDVVFSVANDAIAGHFSTAPLSSINIGGQTIELGCDRTVSRDEAGWIVRCVQSNDIYTARLPVDRQACIKAGDMTIPSARHERAERGDRRVDEHSVTRAAVATIDMHFSDLGTQLARRFDELLKIAILIAMAFVVGTAVTWATIEGDRNLLWPHYFFRNASPSFKIVMGTLICGLLVLIAQTAMAKRLGTKIWSYWICARHFAVTHPLAQAVLFVIGFLALITWLLFWLGIASIPEMIADACGKISLPLLSLSAAFWTSLLDPIKFREIQRNLKKNVQSISRRLSELRSSRR